MKRKIRAFVASGGLLIALSAADPALSEKSGGILRVHALDSPPSMSIHEEVDAVPARAMMGVFNNLVMFDQHVKQNSQQSIVPDLASSWSWSEDGIQVPLFNREVVSLRPSHSIRDIVKPEPMRAAAPFWLAERLRWRRGCSRKR